MLLLLSCWVARLLLLLRLLLLWLRLRLRLLLLRLLGCCCGSRCSCGSCCCFSLQNTRDLKQRVRKRAETKSKRCDKGNTCKNKD